MWGRNGVVSEWGRGTMGWQRSNYCVSGGCLLSLSKSRRGFQDVLKFRPSSLFMLCECNSSSMASLTSQSMYLVLAERSLVSCSLMIWSWLMLCSATDDLSVCASCIVAYVYRGMWKYSTHTAPDVLNPGTRQRKKVCFLTQLLYPEHRLSGWQGWDHLGGCLDDMKTRETFSLTQIDQWFHGHPALLVKQAPAQQIQKFPILHRELILGFQVLRARSIPSGTSHKLCKVKLILSLWLWTSQLPSSIQLWTMIHVLFHLLPLTYKVYKNFWKLPRKLHVLLSFVTLTYTLLCNVVHYQFNKRNACLSECLLLLNYKKSYLHLLLSGQRHGKYSFLWKKVHNHRKELPIFVNAPVLFSSVGFPYKKNTEHNKV